MLGTVHVRTLTLKEVGEIQKDQKTHQDEPMRVAKRVVEIAAVNEDGSPLFVGEDRGLIDDLPFAAIDALAEAILKFNKMSGDDPKAVSPSASPNGSN